MTKNIIVVGGLKNHHKIDGVRFIHSGSKRIKQLGENSTILFVTDYSSHEAMRHCKKRKKVFAYVRQRDLRKKIEFLLAK